MYHSTSGKLGFTPHAVPLRGKEFIPVITKSQMRRILLEENRLRLSRSYQAQITQTGYVLADLHRVTLGIQRLAIKHALGTDVIARFTAHANATAEAAGRHFSKFQTPVMDNLLTQLHNARYAYRNDPDMNALTVYQRFDRSRPGSLKTGDAAPDVTVVDLTTGEERPLLSYLPDKEEPLVLVCGSVS